MFLYDSSVNSCNESRRNNRYWKQYHENSFADLISSHFLTDECTNCGSRLVHSLNYCPCSSSTVLSSMKSNPIIFDKDIDDIQLKETIFDIIKTIKDPEKPATLEDLNVVQEDDIHIVDTISSGAKVVQVIFTPTVPHCSLATLIGLCIRVKLQRMLIQRIKVDIYVKEGTHATESEINKQVNDKERVAAAMENPNLNKIVENCIKEEE